MALIPYALRPATIIRRKAIRQGLLGPSTLWKFVAAWVFGKSVITSFFGKQPESLGTWNVGSNKFVNVINAKPPGRRRRKELKAAGVTRKMTREAIIAAAIADTRRANPDATVVVKTK